MPDQSDPQSSLFATSDAARSRRAQRLASPLDILRSPEFQKYFWRRVDGPKAPGADQPDPDACWLWTGAHDKKGYGSVRIGGRQLLAHRVAYVLSGRTIPPGKTLRSSPECATAAARAKESLPKASDCLNPRCWNLVEEGKRPGRPG